MAVRYRVVQNKIQESKTYGKWYARAISMGLVTTKQLAEEISHSTTVTRSDIMAVLIELANVISTHLLNSESVKIDELGTFRVGIKSVPTDTEEDFKATKIKSCHIIYRPESTRLTSVMDDKGNLIKASVKSLLNGVEYAMLPTSKATKTEDSSSSDSTSGSDSGTGTQNP